jgi:putative hemolysin
MVMPAFQLLSTFRDSRQHTAVVLDEYGDVAGLVSLDDLLSALVGDMPDASVGEEPGFVRRSDGAWVIDAATPLDDVEARLDLDAEAHERADIVTLGGLVMARLGRVPREGDAFVWEGYRVSVARMKGRRVDSVVIEPVARGSAG